MRVWIALICLLLQTASSKLLKTERANATTTLSRINLASRRDNEDSRRQSVAFGMAAAGLMESSAASSSSTSSCAEWKGKCRQGFKKNKGAMGNTPKSCCALIWVPLKGDCRQSTGYSSLGYKGYYINKGIAEIKCRKGPCEVGHEADRKKCDNELCLLDPDITAEKCKALCVQDLPRYYEGRIRAMDSS